MELNFLYCFFSLFTIVVLWLKAPHSHTGVFTSAWLELESWEKL